MASGVKKLERYVTVLGEEKGPVQFTPPAYKRDFTYTLQNNNSSFPETAL